MLRTFRKLITVHCSQNKARRVKLSCRWGAESSMSTSPPSGAAQRVPFRRGSTPSFPPQRPSLDVPPLEATYAALASSQHDYPESPSRSDSYRKAHDAAQQDEQMYSLNDDEPEEKKRTPRKKWSAKKGVVYLILLGCVGLAAKSVFRTDNRKLEEVFRGATQQVRDTMAPVLDDGVCRFVSPVEAYHRDLRRLRQKVADQNNFDLIYPSHPNRTVRSHHHQFSSTGHLLISETPGSPHPIPLLLSVGEKRWEELLNRQSRTLGEASAEYERRYGRRPPKGFDTWWKKAKGFNLVLPDEYDRINLDLAPFFALPKHEMKRRMEMVENMKETFTLIVKDGRVDIQVSSVSSLHTASMSDVSQMKDPGGLKWAGTWPRAKDAASSVQSRPDPSRRRLTFQLDNPCRTGVAGYESHLFHLRPTANIPIMGEKRISYRTGTSRRT